jgi:alanyl-tRNA synthetase
VGDNRHLTFFEMLGNWSLGDYFKREAIEWSWEFMIDPKWLGLDPKRIYVTVFAGDKNAGIDRDDDSIGIWKEQYEKIGISASVCELDQKAEKDSRIFLLGAEDNFWGPAGETGPCGPCTEMFYDVRPDENDLVGTHDELVKAFRLMEIWNDVFMEFNKTASGTYEKMAQQNVDTGMGLERTVTVLSGEENVFDTELFLPIINKINSLIPSIDVKSQRIIADHIKASVFVLSDGVEPSNKDRGYVLRRLIRRAVALANIHDIDFDSEKFKSIAQVVFDIYEDAYPEFKQEDKRRDILKKFSDEIRKFRATIEKGLKEFNKGVDPFILFTTYGFPFELTKELAKEKGLVIDENDFNNKLKQHQELSRTASAGMFKGGLADTKEKTTQLHTATHLMLAGLRKVLGDHIHQKGSNINGERIRFDFSHGEKMTDEQKKEVENFVNEAIAASVPVVLEEMSLDAARAAGAEGAFEDKYGDKVKVYTAGEFSKEICGGPHVENTRDIKGTFKITKEESSSSGVRRIKAVVE